LLFVFLRRGTPRINMYGRCTTQYRCYPYNYIIAGALETDNDDTFGRDSLI